jgi:hypothetical protein
MKYYTGKDRSCEALDPDYERLRRDRNLLKLELDRLNKINTKLNLEVAQNKLKNITLERLTQAIDAEYGERPTEFIKYLYDTAHHFDNKEQLCDDYFDEVTDVL